MSKWFWGIISVVMAAAAVGAADVTLAPAGPLAAGAAAETDAALELKWDNGFLSYRVCYLSGADTWFANDFDVSQFPEYRWVKRLKLYSQADWPNQRWDGFRIALFSFTGGVPASIIWGPKFVRGSSTPFGWTWCSFVVDMTLPAGYNRFATAAQQYYSYPNCDPHGVDNNPTFMGHSWSYTGGRWSPYTTGTPYRNVMMRVVVSNNTSAVAPTSLGRLKALYY